MTGYTRLSDVLAQGSEPGNLLFLCPGCGYPHRVQTGATQVPRWDYNGNPEKPTFHPSVLVRTGSAVDPNFVDEPGDPPTICHSFVKDGQIQFLTDCKHTLAGQTVALPNFNF